MAEFVQFKLADGATVLVEAGSGDQGIARASRAGDVIEAAASSFRSALSTVRKAAGEALQEFRQARDSPEEVVIEFGVLLNAEAGAVIAKSGVQGHFKVTVKWKRAESADTQR
jgi:Trypsin-co-occurring domain 1